MSGDNKVLRVLESPSGAQRLAGAERFLRALPRTQRSLIVAPAPAAASQLLARTLAAGEAVLGVHRHTLSSLAAFAAAEPLAALELTRSTGLSTLSVCVRVIDELLREGALGRFHNVALRPGFARSLASSFEELRCACITHDELSREDPELSRLYARYEATLHTLKLADRARVLELASAALATGNHAFRGLPVLWLDVRLRDRMEAKLFAALLSHSAASFVTLVRGDDRTEGYLHEAGLDLTMERVEPEVRSDLELLQGRLFRSETEASEPERQRGNVQIMSAPGESRETVEIARRILALAEQGVPFDRMAVLLRASEGYRAVLAEALTRAQVPAHYADGVRAPDPAGRALLALLTCAEEGLSARAFAEYLSLGVAPALTVDTQGEAVNELDDLRTAPRQFERLLVDAAVIGGRDRWQRRLSGLQASLRLEVMSLEGDDPRRSTLERDLNGLRSLELFALPILDVLSALPAGGTWGQWVLALTQLAKVAIRDSDGLAELLTELWPLSEIGPVSIAQVRRLLARRVGDVLIRDKGQGAGKVFVGAIEDALGRTFSHCFVLGLAEKIFPARVIEDALVPDGLRRRLGDALRVTDERVLDERLLLRVAVGAASEGLVLSYPRFDVEHGRPRVPSFYGLEVLRAVDGKLPAFDELTRRAEIGAAPRMGWPAPDNALDAIDASEFDLSMIQTLLSSSVDAQRGAARYLLSANATLARSLRFRARRWTLPRFTPADGMVTSGDVNSARTLLAKHRLSARPYSATALATFADCPYKFFLHAVVGLSPRAEIEEVDALDARQRGILFHEVQRSTLEGLRREGLLPLNASQLERALVIMREVLVAEGARVRELCSPAIESVFDDTLRDVEHDLTEWLSRVSADPSFVPEYFELGFGLSRSRERDAASQDAPIALPQGLLLRGAIDLVERAREPMPDGQRVLRATDHKTGEVPEERLGIVQGGRSLQPVLYALALEAMFGGVRVHSGRLYFCTTRGAFEQHEVPLNGMARAAVTDLLKVIDRSLEQAFLPAAPRATPQGKATTCERCAYQSVCGPYEAERVAQHKDQRALGPLFQVRGLP